MASRLPSTSANSCPSARSCFFPDRRQPLICWKPPAVRDMNSKFWPSQSILKTCWRSCGDKNPEKIEGRQLELSSSFHRLQHGDLIGIFNVASHRNSGGDTRNLHRWCSCPPDLLREIKRGGFSFDRGIGGDDHFIHAAVLHPPQKVGNPQLLGANAVSRRNAAMQYVVNA